MGRLVLSGVEVQLGLLFSLAQSILARLALRCLTSRGEGHMLKKMAAVLFMIVLVFAVSVPGFAKDSSKQDRVEGQVVRSNPEKSTLTVRVRETESERTVHYDASTKWVSQYHADKKVNTIDPNEVKDGDQVICLGSYDDKKDFHAATISKRLSHSPN